MANDSIISMLEEMALYDGESPEITLSPLISEVKMWRSKDEYDKKVRLNLNSAIIQKLKNSGLSIE